MKNYSILIVDDIDSNIFTLKLFLNEYFEDINIFSSLNVTEAINIVKENALDLILCDLQMPEKDGFELARFVSKNKETKDIPFLLISGIYNDKKTLEEAYANGVTDFISKPFDEQQLYKTIKKLLKVTNDEKSNKKSFIDLISNIN